MTEQTPFVSHTAAVLGGVEAESIPVELDLVIEQRVLDGDDEVDRYVVIFHNGAVAVDATADTQPDIVISQDLETAEAIRAGTANAQTAYLTGRLTIDGDVDKLLSVGASLQHIVTAIEPRSPDDA